MDEENEGGLLDRALPLDPGNEFDLDIPPTSGMEYLKRVQERTINEIENNDMETSQLADATLGTSHTEQKDKTPEKFPEDIGGPVIETFSTASRNEGTVLNCTPEICDGVPASLLGPSLTALPDATLQIISRTNTELSEVTNTEIVGETGDECSQVSVCQDNNSAAYPDKDLDADMEINEWKIEYDFTKARCISEESQEFKRFENNYLKGCKWSPDGSCLLTNSNDNTLRLFNLPAQLWNSHVPADTCLPLALRMAEGGLIYDYCWYPLMTSQNPDSCCIASTSRGGPVHLWDAFTGQLRCTYRAYDHLDELTSPKTITFNNAGDKIYCGFEKVIRVFDTALPGRECQTISYKSTKKRQVRGQAGIMSCIAFHPDDTMFAVGTYSKTVGLYSSENNKCVVVVRGHNSGVTQVRFLPNGNHLLSGTRKDNDIYCWDIRQTRAPLYRMQRDIRTNQRIQFGVDPGGRYFVSGNHDGRITFWDSEADLCDGSDTLSSSASFDGHEDTVNGTDLHPYLPLLASASGQHHAQINMDLDSEGEECASSSESVENSVKLWWIGMSDLISDV